MCETTVSILCANLWGNGFSWTSYRLITDHFLFENAYSDVVSKWCFHLEALYLRLRKALLLKWCYIMLCCGFCVSWTFYGPITRNIFLRFLSHPCSLPRAVSRNRKTLFFKPTVVIHCADDEGNFVMWILYRPITGAVNVCNILYCPTSVWGIDSLRDFHSCVKSYKLGMHTHLYTLTIWKSNQIWQSILEIFQHTAGHAVTCNQCFTHILYHQMHLLCCLNRKQHWRIERRVDKFRWRW